MIKSSAAIGLGKAIVLVGAMAMISSTSSAFSNCPDSKCVPNLGNCYMGCDNHQSRDPVAFKLCGSVPGSNKNCMNGTVICLRKLWASSPSGCSVSRGVVFDQEVGGCVDVDCPPES